MILTKLAQNYIWYLYTLFGYIHENKNYFLYKEKYYNF